MNKKWLSAALAAGLVMSSVTACQGKPEAAPVETTGKEAQSLPSNRLNPEERPEAAVKRWTKEQENNLYYQYLSLDRSLLDRIDSGIERYFDRVERQEEFVPLEKGYDTYSVSEYDIKTIDEAYQQLQEKAEPTELDEAFLALHPSLQPLAEIINQIDGYTELKAYLDDDYAKGKEYHAVLWDAYNQYAEHAADFHALLAVYTDQKLADDMAQAEQDGQMPLYHTLGALKMARQMDAELTAQEMTNKTMINMDVEKMQPLYDEFLIHVNELLVFAKDEEALYEGGIPDNGRWDQYFDAMKDTKTSMTLLLRNAKEKKDTYPTSIAGDGSIGGYRSGLEDMMAQYQYMFN